MASITYTSRVITITALAGIFGASSVFAGGFGSSSGPRYGGPGYEHPREDRGSGFPNRMGSMPNPMNMFGGKNKERDLPPRGFDESGYGGPGYGPGYPPPGYGSGPGSYPPAAPQHSPTTNIPRGDIGRPGGGGFTAPGNTPAGGGISGPGNVGGPGYSAPGYGGPGYGAPGGGYGGPGYGAPDGGYGGPGYGAPGGGYGGPGYGAPGGGYGGPGYGAPGGGYGGPGYGAPGGGYGGPGYGAPGGGYGGPGYGAPGGGYGPHHDYDDGDRGGSGFNPMKSMPNPMRMFGGSKD